MNFHHPDIIDDDAPENPAKARARRVNVSPVNPNVIVQGPFYRVSTDMSRVPLADYLDHGYETRREFSDSIEQLIRQWGGREGECVEEISFHGKDGEVIDERHKQLHLRFFDTPCCRPDEAWLPMYLLDRCDTPEYAKHHEPTEREELLNEIYAALWGK